MLPRTFKDGVKCGCGKKGRYVHMRDGVEIYSCNKYLRCPTYDELLGSYKKSDGQVWMYRNFVNAIDDYFEYRCESKKDQKKVHQLLQNLTEALAGINNEKTS